MKKTLLAILLCLAMLAGNVHFAHAEGTEAPAEAEAPEETGTSEENEAAAEDRTVLDSGTCGTDLTWILYEDGELVVSGSGDMVDGITESPWHSVRRRIKKVVIEDGVTSIGALAFYDCINLTDISIPNSVTRIGNSVFANCSSLNNITVPDSVNSFGEEIFTNCKNLTDVKLPAGMAGIPHSMFSGCTSLTELTIPESAAIIKANAFYNCDKLEKLTIPESVSEIEHTTFYSCSSLKWVVVLNDDIWIEENAFEYASPVIYAHEGSAAEAFAAEHGMTFRSYTDGMEISEGEPSTDPSQEDRIDICNAVVLGLSKVYYDGTTLGQPYEVYVDGVHLIRGQDYTAVYENNILPGEGRIVITGIGRYTGVKVATFEIGWHYYIYYDPNGGEGEPHTEIMSNGNLIGLGSTDIYKMEGFHIASWNTKADGTGTDYLPDQMVSDLAGPNEMITVYAQWKRDTYTVRFNANGGTGSMAPQTMTLGTAAALNANVFTRTGYSFAGWSTQEFEDEPGTDYADKAEVLDLCKWNGESIMLYARWKAHTYTIKFNANGGTGTMAEKKMTYSKFAVLTANAFTRKGYTFTGWNTRADGSGTFYDDTEAVNNLTGKDSAAVTLYAQWKVNSYTIKFSANGGTGTMAAKKMTYGKSAALTANAFTRKGYTFTGWNTKADGSGKTYANKAAVKNLKSANGTSITLYAQWKAHTYTIKFNANGGTGTMAAKEMTYGKSAALTANAFKRKGYTFTGWNTKADGSGKDYANKAVVKNLKSANGASITLYAQWKANSYTIRFNANGGTGTMAAKKMTYGKSWRLTANAFTRKGYSFTGWNTKADGSGKDYANKAVVKNLKSANGASITLYARWKKTAPVLTKLTLSGSSTVKEGLSIQLSCTRTPSGYKGSLTYASSNTAVATVSSSGLVRGISEGTVTITVKGVNGVKATKKITVTSNSYDFGSARAVSSYGSGVTIAPKRMSYSGSTLVLTAYIVNNSSYTIDGYNNLVITAYTDGGSRIVSKDLGDVDLGIAPHSIKTMTFRLSGASIKDLTGGGFLKTSGTCWFH